MSTSTQESDPSISNFISIFSAASEKYKKLTKQDLYSHPFAAQLDRCDSPAEVLDVFRTQAEAFQEFRKGDERLMKWLDPIVNILTKFSATVSAGNALIVSFKEFHLSRSQYDNSCFLATLTRKCDLYCYYCSPRGTSFPSRSPRVPLTSTSFRRRRMLSQAMTLLSTSSRPFSIFFDVSTSIRRSDSQLK